MNLFTRPRRFGKTLNMSMLRAFFEIGTDSALFEGLYISKNRELCREYMGKYPVIFISLKGVDGMTFSRAKNMLAEILKEEADRHYYLKSSDKLTEEDKEQFRKILLGTDETIENSIKTLSRFLYKHYGQKTIIIIDEYDVPLDKAFQNGYYHEMVKLMRGILGQALKTNDFLQFAVLTGCLRISKESIFTGLNNFKVLSILDARTGIVVELKYAEDGDMEAACAKALTQIDEKNYIMKLKQDGMRNFIKYGIACYKKDCKVVLGE